MAKLSRNKGVRIEHTLVALHVEIGVKAERVSLSGVSRYRGNGSDSQHDQVWRGVSTSVVERSLAPKLDNLIGGCAVVAVTGRTEPVQESQTGTLQDRL
jgi:hypothetical protein